MSNCNTCVKVHPLPECIEMDAYNPYYLEGLNFTDIETEMVAKVKNNATNKVVYIPFETDIDGDVAIDIYNLFPLMNHIYTIEFINKETGNPETFTITNADETTSTGCCIEFGVNIGYTDDNEYFYVSSQDCTA